MRASKLDLAWGEGGKGERGPTRDEEAQPSRCFPRAGPGGGGGEEDRQAGAQLSPWGHNQASCFWEVWPDT